MVKIITLLSYYLYFYLSVFLLRLPSPLLLLYLPFSPSSSASSPLPPLSLTHTLLSFTQSHSPPSSLSAYVVKTQNPSFSSLNSSEVRLSSWPSSFRRMRD